MALFPLSDMLTTLNDGLSKALRIKGEVNVSNRISSFSQSNIDVLDIGTILVGENPNRNYILVINNSDTDIYLSLSIEIGVNTGIRVNANGGSYEMSSNIGNLWLGKITCSHSASASKSVLVIEGCGITSQNPYLVYEPFDMLSSVSNGFNNYVGVFNGAIVKVSTLDVANGEGNFLIQSNKDGDIVTTEYLSKKVFSIPNITNQMVSIELRGKYPANVSETQFGVSFVNKNENTQNTPLELANDIEFYRGHISKSIIKSANYKAIQGKVINGYIAMLQQASPTNITNGNYFTLKLTLKKETNGYTLTLYENGVATLTKTISTIYMTSFSPCFYINSSATTSESVLIDYFKVF